MKNDTDSRATQETPIEKLTYNSREARQALGVSSTTLWRWERAGLIVPVGGIRTKLYSVAALRRFVDAAKS